MKKKEVKKVAKKTSKAKPMLIDRSNPVVKELRVYFTVHKDGTEDITCSSSNGVKEIPALVRHLCEKLGMVDGFYRS